MNMYEDSPALKKAISIWSNGYDITLTLEAELFEEGLNVSALRQKYFNY